MAKLRAPLANIRLIKENTSLALFHKIKRFECSSTNKSFNSTSNYKPRTLKNFWLIFIFINANLLKWALCFFYDQIKFVYWKDNPSFVKIIHNWKILLAVVKKYLNENNQYKRNVRILPLIEGKQQILS